MNNLPTWLYRSTVISIIREVISMFKWREMRWSQRIRWCWIGIYNIFYPPF